MPIREYTDHDGVPWQVWNIWPFCGSAIPRASRDRRKVRRSSGDRRQTQLTPGLESGWLCFQSRLEERRLSPIPDDWTSCSDEALHAYCEQADRIEEPLSTLARTTPDPPIP